MLYIIQNTSRIPLKKIFELVIGQMKNLQISATAVAHTVNTLNIPH